MAPTRRGFLRAVMAGAVVGTAGCSGPGEGGETPTTSPPGTVHTGTAPATSGRATGSRSATLSPVSSIPDPVGLETVAGGFVSPIAFANPTEGLRYVADQVGRVHLLRDGGRETFLDVTDRMVPVSGYSERGLLGMAFHPDYPGTPRVYVRYSAPLRDGMPPDHSHTFVLSEFEVSTDGRRAKPDSERTLLEIPQPQSNHNAGAIAFGPDGHLHVGVGDGGGANDTGTGHVDDWYGANPGGNGQDVETNLLGSVLRIDPDAREGDRGYGIPDGNPLVGEPGLDEHYAWGFRNPWRMSFSGEELFVADVGQNRYEEVDLVRKGGNYGWNVREGRHCFGSDGGCPERAPDGERLREPIVEYPHSGEEPSGVAVIGGYRYRGDALPGLRGRYVFGDWRAQGTLFVASRAGEEWSLATIDVTPASKVEYLLAFGRDRAGELHALTTRRGGVSGSTGALHRVVPAG